jgi:hypothetical protein
VEPGLEHRLGLGLESLPRLATRGRPVGARGLRPLGSSAALGATTAGTAAVGAGRQLDVEPDCSRLGILEQRNLDSVVIRHSTGWR